MTNQKYQRRCKPRKNSEGPLFGNSLPIIEPYLKENESKTKCRPKNESHFDPMHRNRSIRSKDASIPISAVVTLPSLVTGLVGHSRRLTLRFWQSIYSYMIFIWETGIAPKISSAPALCGGMRHPPTRSFSLYQKHLISILLFDPARLAC